MKQAHKSKLAAPKTEVLEQPQWTCSITRLVIEQVSQNAPHFAVFLAVVGEPLVR
jgi:hypothetical protein